MMYQRIRQIRSLGDKVRFLFYKPGWLPKEMGGYQHVKPVDRTSYRKYDTVFPVTTGYYVLFQYVIILALTAIFLFSLNKFILREQVAVILVVIWTILNCGGLFEHRRWAEFSEYLRVLVITGAGITLIYLNDVSFLILIPVISFLLVSFFWLARIFRTSKETSIS